MEVWIPDGGFGELVLGGGELGGEDETSDRAIIDDDLASLCEVSYLAHQISVVQEPAIEEQGWDQLPRSS